MFGWLRNKSTNPEFAKHQLPGEVGTVELPSSLIVEMEGNDILLAYPQGPETISLRFTSISFSKKDNDETGGIKSVEGKATERGVECQRMQDKAIISYDEDSEQDGTPLLMRYWEVGSKNTIVIVSATILKGKENSTQTKRTLELMPRILESLQINVLHRIVEVDGEQIEATVTTAEPVEQKITPFATAETTWLEESLSQAKKLGIRYGSGGELTPTELDRAFSRWTTEDEAKESGDTVANAFGAAFGEYLREHHGFYWVTVEDEYGREYAVRHRVGATMAFPRASVQKRIEDGIPEFFNNVYHIVLDQLQKSATNA